MSAFAKEENELVHRREKRLKIKGRDRGKERASEEKGFAMKSRSFCGWKEEKRRARRQMT